MQARITKIALMCIFLLIGSFATAADNINWFDQFKQLMNSSVTKGVDSGDGNSNRDISGTGGKPNRDISGTGGKPTRDISGTGGKP